MKSTEIFNMFYNRSARPCWFDDEPGVLRGARQSGRAQPPDRRLVGRLSRCLRRTASLTCKFHSWIPIMPNWVDECGAMLAAVGSLLFDLREKRYVE